MTVLFSQTVHRFFNVLPSLLQLATLVSWFSTSRCTTAYKTSALQISRLAPQYILEAQRVDWVMNVRDEWFGPGTGYASLSIGQFNALGLGVLSMRSECKRSSTLKQLAWLDP